MADRVMIPLPGIGTLSLTREAFEAALIPICAVKAESATVANVASLVDAKAVAAALSLPESWVREKERQGEIPSQRAGRYVRFDLTAVRNALAKTVSGSVGRG